jgi:hypothetical protein
MATFRCTAALLLLASSASAYQRDAAPTLASPRLWPRPHTFTTSSDSLPLSISPCAFQFDVNTTAGDDSDAAAAAALADAAVAIYRPIILRLSRARCGEASDADGEASGAAASLTHLSLFIVANASFNTTARVNASASVGGGGSEGFELRIGASDASLVAASYVGLLRGLETFSQLVTVAVAASPTSSTSSSALRLSLAVPSHVLIRDSPSFAYRGVLVDCARNFIPVASLKRVVDALMFTKMNVLHLHLTDSQSFPLQVRMMGGDGGDGW